jgi:hypothetical protein
MVIFYFKLKKWAATVATVAARFPRFFSVAHAQSLKVSATTGSLPSPSV